MPLGDVKPGMRCTGLSVVRGTEISSFDVEIVDVIAAETGLSGPRILVRVSGPAIDATGIGPGFSGSPVICDGRNAGAISEGLGDYGNDVALATPIEEMIRDHPAAPPASTRRNPALLRAAHPLAIPLTVTGLSGRAATLMRQAALRARRPLIIAPAGPVVGYRPVDLRPGAAVAPSISTGDLALGAVGTVTYRNGEDLWAFGHPFEGVGRRALFPQDAYVYTVIENPLGILEFPRDHVQARLGRRLRAGGDHKGPGGYRLGKNRRAAAVDPASHRRAEQRGAADDARLTAGG